MGCWGKILHLNLHREWFAAIAAKTKRIEYRRRTPYWKTRLENRKYDVIQFRNGYATNAPEMLVEFLGERRIKKRQKCLCHPAGKHSENQTLAKSMKFDLSKPGGLFPLLMTNAETWNFNWVGLLTKKESVPKGRLNDKKPQRKPAEIQSNY